MVWYTVVFLTEDAEYPSCGIPESLMTPPAEGQSFLTYISLHDASHSDTKINHKLSENEKAIFLSALYRIYEDQREMIDLLHSQTNDVRSRWIEDCHLETVPTAHCVRFQLILAPNRANKDSGHKGVSIDYQQGIVQEFDGNGNGFNFHRIDPNELLMAISMNAHDLDAKWFDEKMSGFRCIDWHSTRSYHGFHAVILNKFAIGNYSGLFVPHLWNDHGQYLDFESLLIGIQFLNLWPSNSSMRIGFNSIGAFASVNHLHFQFWDIGDQRLPIELTPKKSLSVRAMGRIAINEIDTRYYPLHGFEYKLNVDRDDAIYSDLDHMARSMFFCIEWLQREDISFNMLLVPGHPFSIFLIPRQTQSTFDDFTEFKTKPGFPEMSGQLILVNEMEWNDMTVETVWNTWRQRIDIGDKRWDEIKQECLSMDM